LTESQYIEVAEKIWGWERHDHQVGDKYYITIDSRILYDDQLHKEVNSWEGFGRTMERFAGDMKYSPKFWALIKPIIAQYLINQADDAVEQFFKQIHLAALEALK